MQHIYIVRHGQTMDNAHKVVTGSRETSLTELGKEQAALAGQQARGLNIGLIVCSPLKRAQNTAQIIAKQIGYPKDEIKIISELAERDLGELEGHSYAKNDRLNGNFPAVDHILGVEPLPHFYTRINHALREIMRFTSRGRILVVCHIGVGRMLRVVVEGEQPSDFYDQPRLENAKIYELL